VGAGNAALCAALAYAAVRGLRRDMRHHLHVPRSEKRYRRARPDQLILLVAKGLYRRRPEVTPRL
jgi:hypothetical protein